MFLTDAFLCSSLILAMPDVLLLPRGGARNFPTEGLELSPGELK